MTLQLQLTEEQGRLILDSASRKDEATLRQVLALAFEATVQNLLRQPIAATGQHHFEATAQKLWSSFAANAGHRPLAPEALSREAIYDDHE